MIGSHRVTLEFGGGEYSLALNGREIEELQRLAGNVGFGAIYQRAVMGNWFHGDIYHTIRLGLEGGGMAPVEAKRIADVYAVPPYQVGHLGGAEQTAIAIIGAAMHGLADLPKSGEAETPKAT